MDIVLGSKWIQVDCLRRVGRGHTDGGRLWWHRAEPHRGGSGYNVGGLGLGEVVVAM